MSQQALDLQRSFRIVRRHFKLFWGFVVLGLLIGVGYAAVKPPVLSSTALVVLPQIASQAAAAQNATGVASPDVIDTQVLIAGSDPVLSAALPHVSPPMSLQTLEKKVQVVSLAGSVVSITASGSTAAQAETTANAVAQSYISYITGPRSAVGHLDAKLLESAANAMGSTLPKRMAIDGVLGLVGGVLVGFVVALAVGRRDRKLKERDRMANAMGIPVLGSFPVPRPAGAAGWNRLLEEHEAGAVHAQSFRAILKRLDAIGRTQADAGADGPVSSVTVLSFTSDAAALALGPQLASFAASEGIATTLIVGPQQNSKAMTALRSAGTQTPGPARQRQLRVVVSDDDAAADPGAARLVVVVAVIDPLAPRLPRVADTDATVLAVSAGIVTPRQLARAALVAATGGREALGILLANPVPGDQTTGRNPRLLRAMRRPQPTRV